VQFVAEAVAGRLHRHNAVPSHVSTYLSAHRADAARRPHLARLRAIAGSRMWKWLFDAHRLLGVTVEVLDDRFEVLLPSREGRLLRERFEQARTERLDHLFSAAVTLERPAVIGGAGVHLACAPIVGAGTLAGAVLIATDESTRLADSDLLRLGSLIANAIADQLARSSSEHRGHLHQISALYQLLHAAIMTGSEREVIRTFAEAVSVWEEIEALTYRADLDGRYTLVAALPGSEATGVPRALPEAPALEGPRVIRLTPDEREGLGLHGEGDTILARLESEGGSWLVLMTSAAGTADGERSEMYAAALGHALNGCLAVETSRLTWALMQQFVDRDPPQDAARRALDELCRALGATGGFSVSGADRTRLLAVGDQLIDHAAPAVLEARRLRAPVAAQPGFTAWLDVRAAPGRLFSPRDVKLFEATVASFSAWLPAAVRRLGPGERRNLVRSFEQIVDRYTQEAHGAGDPASLILVSAGAGGATLETTHAWIKRLRPQLRPTDLAGRLSTGELAILLLQTPASGAQVVARRLNRALTPTAGERRSIRVGVASQRPDLVSADALIAQARVQPIDGSVI
jgi:hypothetical protein